MIAEAVAHPPEFRLHTDSRVSGIRPEQIVRLTVDQYEALIPAGVIQEGAPIELINGVMRWKNRASQGEPLMTVGKRHAMTVVKLHTLLTLLLQGRPCFVQGQLPVSLSAIDEPEPDICVVGGSIEDERVRHPTPDQLVVVVEVSDSSLDDDRGEKLEMYASAGVREYWIVNLVENQIEVHRNPVSDQGRFAARKDFLNGDTVPLALPDGTNVDVDVSRVLT